MVQLRAKFFIRYCCLFRRFLLIAWYLDRQSPRTVALNSCIESGSLFIKKVFIFGLAFSNDARSLFDYVRKMII